MVGSNREYTGYCFYGRELYRYNITFGMNWQGKHYPINHVAPVIKEDVNEIVVIPVYTFYF
jgi:hypothetical protein